VRAIGEGRLDGGFVGVTPHPRATGFASKIHDLCGAAGFRPRIIQEATRAQAVAAMVAAGSGIAILPSGHGI
jgi:DNA-binding transcriptional LysR family regulator